MRRMFLVVPAAVLCMALFATAAFAAAPKFHSATSSVNSAGALVVSFDERGLGNENVDYSLTAAATATYACINGGNKNPSAANKRTMAGQVAGSASFEPKNGRVIATITVGPLSAGSFTCPSGQRLRLTAVSYSNIVLTDTTNNVSTTAPARSRILLSI